MASVTSGTLQAQQLAEDSLHLAKATERKDNSHLFEVKKLIVPAALITYGVFSISNHTVDKLNLSTRYEINEHKPAKISADNYTQYAPAALVYSLNAFGLKSRHNFKDRTILLATSQLMLSALVVPLKYSIRKERPDGSNNHSFPSGHTATAFSTAQFMYREYRSSNRWLSLAGYPFAVFTGVYRTLNNKHWVGDVAAGAGIGILSTEISYWMFPKIAKMFRRDKQLSSTSFYPYFGNHAYGIGFVKQL
ncbi:MAG: phosphatase PAP2 family protein [Chitinophagaceae bacterium]|nr:MAG: phosphatase PAP2 family protein [Chitinophagaceae bacterium]